ncbi:MAG: DnaJ C-terminal domain-containing protein [Novosphingobium sp.]
MAADPYQTLGVARGASEKEIKSAYRKLAKELHPDKNRGKSQATERFSAVTHAYDLLSDANKRQQFDRGEIDADGNPTMPQGFGGGPNGGFGGGGFGGGGFGGETVDLGDIFGGLFGGGRGGFGGGGGQRGPAPKGANVQYRLNVSFADAAARASQRITLADGKSIDLKLPAGVEDGTQMRLTGKGEPGHGGNGDALVTITVQQHAFFRRDGDNIRLDLPIRLDEAVHGGKVKVPTVDGAVMLTIAPGSSSGKTLRISGKGFSRKDGSRGDQLVSLEIVLPEGDTELSKRLEGWSDNRAVRAKLGV